MNLDDLATLIGAGTGLPVHGPGKVAGTLPAVQLVPVQWELLPGANVIFPVVNVVVYRPLAPYSTQYPLLEADVLATLAALRGTDYQLDAVVTFNSDPDSEPSYMAATINVRYHGPSICEE